jgi:hypothetical protein
MLGHIAADQLALRAELEKMALALAIVAVIVVVMMVIQELGPRRATLWLGAAAWCGLLLLAGALRLLSLI